MYCDVSPSCFQLWREAARRSATGFPPVGDEHVLHDLRFIRDPIPDADLRPKPLGPERDRISAPVERLRLRGFRACVERDDVHNR